MARLRDKYKREVSPKLRKELAIKNIQAVPKIIKIAVNVGVGEAKDSQAILERTINDVAALSGQRPLVSRAKGAISGFKISKGDPIGVRVTMRGDRMYDFLDKLTNVVLPKVRDFRGIAESSFDSRGNLTIGLEERSIFPEVSFQGVSSLDRGGGVEISIVTTAKSKEEGKRLLELLGVPFRKSK